MAGLHLVILLLATFATAFLSGIFGMAGGLILMGVLLSLFSVAEAMVLHGSLQMVANGWRGFLLRKHIYWGIIGWYSLGMGLAIGLLFLIAWRPERSLVFLLLGLVPFLVWLPKKWFDLDAQKPTHAVFAGLAVTTLNTFAGVAGPALDIFFVRTELTRHQIVATKSISQVMAHLVKVLFWSGVAITSAVQDNSGLWKVLIVAVPLSMLGTWGGGKVLDRLSDKSFLQWVRFLVTIIGGVYLVRAVLLF